MSACFELLFSLCLFFTTAIKLFIWLQMLFLMEGMNKLTFAIHCVILSRVFSYFIEKNLKMFN